MCTVSVVPRHNIQLELLSLTSTVTCFVMLFECTRFVVLLPKSAQVKDDNVITIHDKNKEIGARVK